MNAAIVNTDRQQAPKFQSRYVSYVSLHRNEMKSNWVEDHRQLITLKWYTNDRSGVIN